MVFITVKITIFKKDPKISYYVIITLVPKVPLDLNTIVIVSMKLRLSWIFGISLTLNFAGLEEIVEGKLLACQKSQTFLRLSNDVIFLPALVGFLINCKTLWRFIFFKASSTTSFLSPSDNSSDSMYPTRSLAKRFLRCLVFGVKILFLSFVSVVFFSGVTGVFAAEPVLNLDFDVFGVETEV